MMTLLSAFVVLKSFAFLRNKDSHTQAFMAI